MQLSDIAKARVNWMESWGNDPHLEIILKRDKDLFPFEQHRYRQYGNLFVAVDENEISYVRHDPRDHEGFGGRHYPLQMCDDWTPPTQPICSKKCHIEGRTVHLYGPWDSGASSVCRVGVPCVSASVMPAKYRYTVSNPDYYRRMVRRLVKRPETPRQVIEGMFIATAITLDFAREVVDRFCPHAEMYEGDYGWVPKMRDCPPKNPRRDKPRSKFSDFASDEQARIIEW